MVGRVLTGDGMPRCEKGGYTLEVNHFVQKDQGGCGGEGAGGQDRTGAPGGRLRRVSRGRTGGVIARAQGRRPVSRAEGSAPREEAPG